MKERNLVLIGFMGTGKSTVGRLCARKLHREFMDSDEHIERREGCSVADLFVSRGEAVFREIERNVIRDLSAGTGRVIATGGGAVIDPENVAALRKSGWTVWLRAMPDAIIARVGNGQSRPLLAGNSQPLLRIEEMLRQRMAGYEQASDHQINTDRMMPDEIAEKIIREFLK